MNLVFTDLGTQLSKSISLRYIRYIFNYIGMHFKIFMVVRLTNYNGSYKLSIEQETYTALVLKF